MVTGPHSLKTTPRILKRLGQKSFIEKDVFSVNDTSDSEETVPSRLPTGDEPMTWLLVQMLNHLATGDL